MTDMHNPPDAALPNEELLRTSPMDEALIAYLFGDDEEDPGPLFQRFAGQAEARLWLEGFARDYARLSGREDGPAIARARALADELERRHQNPIDWAAARGDNVASLAAARTHRTRSKLGPRLAIFGVLAATIAAAVVLVTNVKSAPREVDIEMAQSLVAPIMDQAGHGFAGAPVPTARERGFLLGAIIDLSRPRKATGSVGASELELAQTLADRALEGLDDAPDAAEDRRQRLLGGCAAILPGAEERKACEEGLADYQRRRDAY